MRWMEMLSAYESGSISRFADAPPPHVRILPRTPFEILDLRTRPEPSAVRFGEGERRRISRQYAGPMPLKPDNIFRASDVYLFQGALWVDGQVVRGSFNDERTTLKREISEFLGRAAAADVRRYAGTTAVVNGPGIRNYFHWTSEIFPRLVLLSRPELRDTFDRVYIFFPEVPSFVRQSVRLFAPEIADRIVFGKTATVRFEQALFFVNDRFYVDTDTRFTTSTALLSERIDAATSGAAPPSDVVMISRADAPSRKLVNEAALASYLAPRGVEVALLAGTNLRQQMAKMNAARVVIGVHGAGLTNAIYMQPGTKLIELT